MYSKGFVFFNLRVGGPSPQDLPQSGGIHTGQDQEENGQNWDLRWGRGAWKVDREETSFYNMQTILF